MTTETKMRDWIRERYSDGKITFNEAIYLNALEAAAEQLGAIEEAASMVAYEPSDTNRIALDQQIIGARVIAQHLRELRQ